MSKINILKKTLIAAVGATAALGATPAIADEKSGPVFEEAAESDLFGVPVFYCLVDGGNVIYFVFSREECDALEGEFIG